MPNVRVFGTITSELEAAAEMIAETIRIACAAL